LGKKQYTNYQYLIKLLVIALLINFSLVVCGLLVDISNYLTVLFMSSFNGGNFSCLYTCVVHNVANSFTIAFENMWFSRTLGNAIAAAVGLIFLGQIIGLVIFVIVRMITL
jgi:uncharacterized protein (DUF2062 family)